MFTIKHLDPLGNEALYSATEVTHSSYDIPKPYSPTETGQAFSDLTGSVWYHRPNDNEFIELRSGMVYVMNEHGSTVAKYDLGGWAQGTFSPDLDRKQERGSGY